VSSSTEVTQVRDVVGAETAGVIGTKAPNAGAVNASHVTSAKAAHVASAKASNATAVKATDVTTAKATHVAAAEATHATTMSSTTTTAAAGLCARGNKAAGKYCACQNHHHSSSHDILHLRWADIPPQVQSGVGTFLRGRANVAIDWRWECLFVLSTKFVFIRSDLIRGRHRPDIAA
jgi:hypothetical protein